MNEEEPKKYAFLECPAGWTIAQAIIDFSMYLQYSNLMEEGEDIRKLPDDKLNKFWEDWVAWVNESQAQVVKGIIALIFIAIVVVGLSQIDKH